LGSSEISFVTVFVHSEFWVMLFAD